MPFLSLCICNYTLRLVTAHSVAVFEAVKNKNDISFSAEMKLKVDIATALWLIHRLCVRFVSWDECLEINGTLVIIWYYQSMFVVIIISVYVADDVIVLHNKKTLCTLDVANGWTSQIFITCTNPSSNRKDLQHLTWLKPMLWQNMNISWPNWLLA